MRETFGAKNPRSWLMRFHTQTAGVSLTEQQPEVNLVRVAIQALAAVLGGTQSLHTDAMDEAIALPSYKAARLAVRTQQVILHESGVVNTVDPLGGSYFVERLTADMEADVNKIFNEIEALGGVIPAIERGYFHRETVESSARFQREVETRDRIIVGVNEYLSDEAPEIPILQFDPEGEKRHLARLAKVKAERDASAWAAAMERLEAASREPATNTMQFLVDVVNAGGTVGEVCNLWRRVYGEYKEQVFV
jgi:methylmalonyl-CoA mutase N-terminal domain/subunit